LLDIAKIKKVDRLDIGYAITIDDVKQAMSTQGIDNISTGDVVLFHTGHRKLLEDGKRALFLKGQPGPGIQLAKWLVEQGVVAVGGDSGSMEVMPFESENHLFPVHQILLAQSGVYILENVATERLANKQWYEFMFMAAPLPITGSSSSWINPVAIR
jgi:kynurenine formamidase